MAEKRLQSTKPPVPRQKPVLSSKPSSVILPPAKPCNKSRKDDDDDSDDEDDYGYIQPDSQAGDLANLIRVAGSLPICVKVLSSPQAKVTACEEGDILMIHCTEQEQRVKAIDPSGKTFYLPILSNQLYEILPLDPRLDDKEYMGTMELVEADPLPNEVRVLVGYFDEEDEDDTKEQDDVITIEGVERENNDQLYLVGKIMGEAQRFRAMKDEAVYTTQIISEHLPMSKIIKQELPVRVRTVNVNSPSKGYQKELVFRLENHIKRERVIATRENDGAVFAFPFSTPLNLESITPSWSSITSMITPLYPLVNTSISMKGLHEVSLPLKAMEAVPQPKKEVLEKWLQSPEGKIRIGEIAEQENQEMQRKITSLKEDLKRAESELEFHKREPTRDAPTIPKRSSNESLLRPNSLEGPFPGSQLGLSLRGSEPSLPSISSSNSRANSQEEEPGIYDQVTPGLPSSRTSIGLASTDLEKELKNLLADRILEIQTKEKEYEALQEKYKILQSKFDEQSKKISVMEQQLEVLSDQEDCYETMTPTRKKAPINLSGKEHHLLPNRPPAGTTTLRKPNMPLPSVPTNQGMSRKHPRDEYDPLPIPLLNRDNITPGSQTRSPTKKSVSIRFPLPTEPLQPHSSLEDIPSLTPLHLSQQTDSFKRSMTTRPSSQHAVSPAPHSVSDIKKHAAPFTRFLEHVDVPVSPPPLPPSPFTRSVTKIHPSGQSEYDLPYTEPPLPPAHRKPRPPGAPLSPDHSFNPVMYATPNNDLSTFTKEDVAILLRSLDLGNCVNRFLKESVDGALLMSIDEEMMMKELGMTSIQARKLTIKIDEMTSR